MLSRVDLNKLGSCKWGGVRLDELVVDEASAKRAAAKRTKGADKLVAYGKTWIALNHLREQGLVSRGPGPEVAAASSSASSSSGWQTIRQSAGGGQLVPLIEARLPVEHGNTGHQFMASTRSTLCKVGLFIAAAPSRLDRVFNGLLMSLIGSFVINPAIITMLVWKSIAVIPRCVVWASESMFEQLWPSPSAAPSMCSCDCKWPARDDGNYTFVHVEAPQNFYVSAVSSVLGASLTAIVLRWY